MTEKSEEEKEKEIGALSRLLGVVCFIAFVGVIILDGFVWFTVQWELALLLFGGFLIFLGFGNHLERILKARYQ